MKQVGSFGNAVAILFFALLIFSASVKADDALVSMVSYEQSWLDTKGTIALKNNTTDTVHNVSFRLLYLDMNGNPMDYEEYSYSIEILPGMTRKLDIPAYEHSRSYHYYKTKDEFGHPAFKLEYEFKGYNLADEDIVDGCDGISGEQKTSMVAPIMLILVVFGMIVGVYVLIAVMAKKRNRNPVLWILLSFLLSPIITILVLLCVGESYLKDKY